MLNSEIIDIIKSFGVDFYDSEIVSENGNKIFRIYITSKNGISLDTCTEVTKAISPLIDIDPPIRGTYFLEISSPGIERKLTKPNHFLHSIGEDVRVELYSTEKIEGKLKAFENSSIVIESENEDIAIKLEDIAKAKTIFKW